MRYHLHTTSLKKVFVIFPKYLLDTEEHALLETVWRVRFRFYPTERWWWTTYFSDKNKASEWLQAQCEKYLIREAKKKEE